MNDIKRGNLHWEGNRILLPEHREAWLNRQRDKNKHEMPDLDDDQQSIIDQAIKMSLHTKREITLTIYDPYQDRKVQGYVARIDHYACKLQMRVDDGYEWIERMKIIAVSDPIL